LTDRLLRAALGDSDIRAQGARRALRGAREADNRELALGLALSALSYLRGTKPRRRLIYRKVVPEGSAIVVHNRRWGDPKLEIVKPKRRRRQTR
jgi:hypothetical protein